MLGRDDHECDSVYGVQSCCEDRPVLPVYLEVDIAAVALPYPIFLHYLYPFRPFQLGDEFQEFVRIFGCLDEPLLQMPNLYVSVCMSPAFSVMDLLVC